MATSTGTPPQGDNRPLTPEQLTAHLNGAAVSRDRTWQRWMFATVGLVSALALVAIVSSLIALGSDNPTTTIIRQAAVKANPVSNAGTSSSKTPVGSGTMQAGAGLVVPIVLQKDAAKGTAGTITGRDGWPRYAPSNITIPSGKTVTLVITNYDDMSTPLAAGEPYNKVMGGSETVNGKSVTYVSNKIIAHTFTVTGLGVNVPIPVAPMGTGTGTTVTFTFKAGKKGTYTWQCYTPCGSGPKGVGGPMVTPGYMTGTITVV